ncbi:MAG TPA: hypothetical protein VK184_07735 [Nostocaceae cyanobacterium]|nr:hypothetical protein [Nostocaceae cyanobacterium]
MSNFKISISSPLSPSEIEYLETSLSLSSLKTQITKHRAIGVDDIVVIVSVASATAQLIDYGIKAAKAINNWRKELQEKGIKPQGKLKHPQLPDLDLNAATDEQIKAWFGEWEKWLSQQ